MKWCVVELIVLCVVDWCCVDCYIVVVGNCVYVCYVVGVVVGDLVVVLYCYFVGIEVDNCVVCVVDWGWFNGECVGVVCNWLFCLDVVVLVW